MLVLTFEFDQWDRDVKDRLDVLGLGSDGRLIVGELKRGIAPDTTDVQAIKYAAMASRFTVETLTDRYRQYLMKYKNRAVTVQEAQAELDAHCDGQLTDESLRRPRIVLVAEGFSRTTTSSAVWLTEMGVKTSLVTFRAYRTPSGDLPDVPWTLEEITTFAETSGTIALALIDHLASRPGQEVANAEPKSLGYTAHQTAGASGSISRRARGQYGRANAPIGYSKASGIWKYVMNDDVASLWRPVRGLEIVEPTPES